MQKKIIHLSLLAMFMGFANARDMTTSITTEGSSSIISGINQDNMNRSVNPANDFYSYVNGKWLETAKIPEDKSSWGAFYELREKSIKQLYDLIVKLNAKSNLKVEEQKISTMYASYMDEPQLNKLGITPLTPIFAKIDSIKDKSQLPELIAYLNQIGVNAPYDISIHQDAKDSTKMIADIGQSGLGLPDRDYYMDTADKNLAVIKDKYKHYIEEMLTLSGDKSAKTDAVNILNLESQLANIQWTKVENRDPVKTYNNVKLTHLNKIMPQYNWQQYLMAAGLKNKLTYLIISQPSYLQNLDKIIQKTPLTVWQSYFKWQVLNNYASLLSSNYAVKSFAFYGTTLRGIPQNSPRWKRGIGIVEGTLGFSLGKLYVEEYFPQANKIKMQALVKNLITEYNQSINSLDWMDAHTKLEAKKKLDTMMLKIAYPDKWRDYSKLVIKSDDLLGNVISSSMFEYQRSINKLGKPVERTEWGMTPQTVNAYYNPELNEIVFPAAILQPPFFNADADDAVNYGGIGAVIGHEISHAFDDQGSQYDEKGNLRNWWTPADHKKFKAKTTQLVSQYNAYSPVKGYNINGELTLGENIADNSGLAIAYKAYHLSLNGENAQVIDDMTGDQRFYSGWAQVWRSKTREAQEIMNLKTDPHSPAMFRCNGALSNQDGFYKAFNIESGNKMYFAPSHRVTIW